MQKLGQDDEGVLELMAAVLLNPELLAPNRQSYEKRQTLIEQDGIDPVLATIIRLAVDGLWFSELLAFAPPREPLRAQLIERLLSLTTLSDKEERS